MNNKGILAISGIAVGGVVLGLLMNKKRQYEDLEVAPNVDLEKYAGEWYEIARLPAKFEKGCFAAKANYSLTEDGAIKVVNTCHKDSLKGETVKVEGKAIVDDEITKAKLKVQFFWPIKGDYWILDVDDEYKFALVGEPSRTYLWILSRTPDMPKRTLDRLIGIAKEKGFDVEKLKFTEQKKEEAPKKTTKTRAPKSRSSAEKDIQPKSKTTLKNYQPKKAESKKVEPIKAEPKKVAPKKAETKKAPSRRKKEGKS